MLNQLKRPVIAVVGPTASGKSALAQALALHVDAEVISADSMQVYRGMDIGTGKLLPSQRKVPHFGLDLCDPGQPYSAALFQSYARECFCALAERGKTAVLCGGTGLYVRAAIDAYEFPQGDQVNNPLRARWEALAREQGALAVWELLAQRDAKSADIIPPADTKRVVRALELFEEGICYANQREKLAHIPQLVPAIFVGLAVDPALLNQRIDQRVDEMLEEGLVSEVEGLLEHGFREGITAPQAIGYKEIVQALDGDISLEEAVLRIKIATHRYAKRQRTWFRKDRRIHWIDANKADVQSLFLQALDVVALPRERG